MFDETDREASELVQIGLERDVWFSSDDGIKVDHANPNPDGSTN